MLLELRNKCIEIFLADQQEAARAEGKRVPAVLTLDHAPQFNTKREHDQYTAACAELRAVKAVLKKAHERIATSAKAAQALLENNTLQLNEAAQHRVVEDHARYIQPILRGIEANEVRERELQEIIDGLLRGAKE